MQIKEQKGFQVLPKRWVVERTFAWLNGSLWLSKDYEASCCSAETMIMISHADTLLKRLAYTIIIRFCCIVQDWYHDTKRTDNIMFDCNVT